MVYYKYQLFPYFLTPKQNPEKLLYPYMDTPLPLPKRLRAGRPDSPLKRGKYVIIY